MGNRSNVRRDISDPNKLFRECGLQLCEGGGTIRNDILCTEQKLSIALRFPWKRDVKLDALTRGMVVAGSQVAARPTPTRRAPDGTKIGRNDPCACGSGKKFKKCCLK